MADACSALIDDLVALRKEKGISQKELSAACGLTQSVIARIERKRSTPTLSTFSKIVEALGASITLQSNE